MCVRNEDVYKKEYGIVSLIVCASKCLSDPQCTAVTYQQAPDKLCQLSTSNMLHSCQLPGGLGAGGDSLFALHYYHESKFLFCICYRIRVYTSIFPDKGTKFVSFFAIFYPISTWDGCELRNNLKQQTSHPIWVPMDQICSQPDFLLDQHCH